MARKTGKYERTSAAGESVEAFVPNPLPPADPPLTLAPESERLLQSADESLRRLSLGAEMVPSLDWVLYGANEAIETARELFGLIGRDRTRVLAGPSSSVMAARLFELLPDHPILTIAAAMDHLDTTRPTAAKAIDTLVESGVLLETSGKKRGRAFSYAAYLDLLKEETEPL